MKRNFDIIWNENDPNLNEELKDWIQTSLDDLENFRCQIDQSDLSKR